MPTLILDLLMLAVGVAKSRLTGGAAATAGDVLASAQLLQAAIAYHQSILTAAYDPNALKPYEPIPTVPPPAGAGAPGTSST